MSTSAYGQYRDASAPSKKEKSKVRRKKGVDKKGLFGFKKNGAFTKPKDPFSAKDENKHKQQYGEKPQNKKKPKKLVLFKNKKNKPPKKSNKKLKEKDSFTTKVRGKRHNKDYSQKKEKNRPKKKSKDRKLYKKT